MLEIFTDGQDYFSYVNGNFIFNTVNFRGSEQSAKTTKLKSQRIFPGLQYLTEYALRNKLKKKLGSFGAK